MRRRGILSQKRPAAGGPAAGGEARERASFPFLESVSKIVKKI